MKQLFQPLKIKNIEMKNRISFPSMVCYAFGNEEGLATEKHVEHYRAIARGGAGLIIQEATCVDPSGRLSGQQLGIWEDRQIEGLSKITEAVHKEGCPIFLQLHHAGAAGLDGELACPSDYVFLKNGNQKTGKEMTIEEIRTVQERFVEAAKRAYRAGYDGVELHGCHQYLICEFLNRWVNKRRDQYGENKILFVLEILEKIRKAVPEEFVVGIRLGGFEPRLEDGIAFARALDQAGIDFIDVSYGFSGEDMPISPANFPYEKCIYAAQEIKKKVSVPVFAVHSITNPQMAERILGLTGVDAVQIGRGMIVNPNWVRDAMEGRDTGKCLHCKKCFWSENSEVCSGRKVFHRRYFCPE